MGGPTYVSGAFLFNFILTASIPDISRTMKDRDACRFASVEEAIEGPIQSGLYA